jgi:hypothetical protein
MTDMDAISNVQCGGNAAVLRDVLAQIREMKAQVLELSENNQLLLPGLSNARGMQPKAIWGMVFYR